MAYTKGLITTTVYAHGYGDGDSFVFADTPTSRDGSTARKQILNYGTVYAKDTSDSIEIIPYHAIIYAYFTRAESDPITPPEDAFCVSAEPSPEPDPN